MIVVKTLVKDKEQIFLMVLTPTKELEMIHLPFWIVQQVPLNLFQRKHVCMMSMQLHVHLQFIQ